jgi:hypothetical protein
MAVSAPLLPSAAKPPWARWEAAHPKEAEAEEEEGEEALHKEGEEVEVGRPKEEEEAAVAEAAAAVPRLAPRQLQWPPPSPRA